MSESVEMPLCPFCPPEKAKEGLAVVAKLIEVAGWSDKSVTHALLHVENLIQNLRADVRVAEAELSKAIDAIQAEAHRGDELKAEVERLKQACSNCAPMSTQSGPSGDNTNSPGLGDCPALDASPGASAGGETEVKTHGFHGTGLFGCTCEVCQGGETEAPKEISATTYYYNERERKELEDTFSLGGFGTPLRKDYVRDYVGPGLYETTWDRDVRAFHVAWLHLQVPNCQDWNAARKRAWEEACFDADFFEAERQKRRKG